MKPNGLSCNNMSDWYLGGIQVQVSLKKLANLRLSWFSPIPPGK